MEREKWENNDACIIMGQRIKETEKMKRGYYIARVFSIFVFNIRVINSMVKEGYFNEITS